MIKTIKLTNGKSVPLRGHQIEAIVKLSSHYADGNDRAKMIHCCRSGKSLTAVAMHKELKSNASVVFLPNINLIQQTVEDWKPNIPKARILVISCDKTSYDGEVTTNSKKIRKFIKDSKGKEFVIFSTYQSSKKLCKALEKVKNFSFDFLVADEAHRSAGVNLKQSRYIHFNTCISARMRLYMTATPKLISAGLAEFLHSDAEKLCMSDLKIFGKEVHAFSFKEGIETNILSDYEIVALGCKNAVKVDAIEDQSNFNHTHIKETAKLHALHRALSDRNLTHCVSFHSSKAKAKFFERNFDLEGWSVFHINGDHNAEERKKTLDAFRTAEKALLTNCKCLNEGVNLIECDSVFFSDVKSGAVDVVQSASRPLTRDLSKPQGFKNAIFIPTFHLVGDSMEQVCATTAYKILIQLIRHMRGQDSRIEAFLHTLSRVGSTDLDDPENIIKMEGFDGLQEDLFSSIIPHDIEVYSDREIFKSFKDSFSGRGPKGGMRTASLNLGMGTQYVRIRVKKSSWLKKKVEEFRASLKVTQKQIFNAVKEAKGSLSRAGIILGKSTGFVGNRVSLNPLLGKRIEKWMKANPDILECDTRWKASFSSDEIVEAFKNSGYNKKSASVSLGKSADYISSAEERSPELRELLYQEVLKIKPDDMSEEDFKHGLRYGGRGAFLRKLGFS